MRNTVKLITSEKFTSLRYYIISTLVVLYFLKYYRYKKVIKFEAMQKKWREDDHVVWKRKGAYVLSFIIISFLICIILAGILGEINQGRMQPIF